MTELTLVDTTPAPDCEVEDGLELLFNLQKRMQFRLHPEDGMLPAIVPHRIPMTVTSIIAELGEILEDEQHWKDWKKNPAATPRDHLRMEIADLWHFVINLTLVNGFDAADIRQEFINKNLENHARQDRGY